MSKREDELRITCREDMHDETIESVQGCDGLVIIRMHSDRWAAIKGRSMAAHYKEEVSDHTKFCCGIITEEEFIERAKAGREELERREKESDRKKFEELKNKYGW